MNNPSNYIVGQRVKFRDDGSLGTISEIRPSIRNPKYRIFHIDWDDGTHGCFDDEDCKEFLE